MKINLETLLILSDIFDAVPLRTPNRLSVIFEFASNIITGEERANTHCDVIMDIHDENSFENVKFELNIENIARLEQNIPKLEHYSDYRKHLPKILIPTQYHCCGSILKILPSYASLKLFTADAVLQARSYHGKCKICKVNYYHGFKEHKKTGEREFNVNDLKVIIFNSGMAYSKDFLRNVDSIICIGGVSFEKSTEIFMNNFDENDEVSINPDRLEAAWFIYRILEFVTVFKEWPRKEKTKELDIERLCKLVYEKIRDTINNKWLNHICNEIGCKERYVVIDGNEKLHRLICAAEKSKIMGNYGQPNSYDMCIRNPVRGNQYQDNSKYCHIHSKDNPGNTDEQLDIRPITRQYAKQLIPKTIVSNEGCKRADNIDRFHSRTAGMFYIFRSCGIRLANFEMFTAESLSQVFVYMIDTFGESFNPDDLRGIVYDRACDLEPFINRLSKEGNFAASKYETLKYMVDIFHVEKHTQVKCILKSEECRYHPHLERFNDVKGMNTEIAEQSFSRINPFKFMSRKMSYCKRLLFLKFIDHSANIQVLKKSAQKKVCK